MDFQCDVDENVSVTSSSMSPDFWETCGSMAARKAMTGMVTSTFGPTARNSAKTSREVWNGLFLVGNASLSGALGCPKDASDGQQMNVVHTGELYFFHIKKEPIIDEATDDEDGTSFWDEQG